MPEQRLQPKNYLSQQQKARIDDEITIILDRYLAQQKSGRTNVVYPKNWQSKIKTGQAAADDGIPRAAAGLPTG